MDNNASEVLPCHPTLPKHDCESSSDDEDEYYDTDMSPWPLDSYRPRGSLARILHEKQKSDRALRFYNKSQWYHCNLDGLPEDVTKRFLQMHMDKDTRNFVRQASSKSDSICTQVWHSMAKAFLGWFMTQTSINGWLRRGSMFVLSTSQFEELLNKNTTPTRRTFFLDIGAGDGAVTARLAPLFAKVYVTEVSTTMQELLERQGFEIINADEWNLELSKLDVISCLNVIDRCNTPLLLLHQIKMALHSQGLALISLVLPYSPYVETGSKDHKPLEQLPIRGSTFEQQVASLIKFFSNDIGFEVIAWTKVPYLCEGDLHQSYYWLDDAVFLLKPKEED